VAKRINQKTKMDQIVEILREAVLTGEFTSGARLLQDDLAERFNTSSTPIREALRQLQAEGILEHSPYRGVQVAEVKMEDVREVYMIRAVMESYVTRLAVPYLNHSHLEQLRSLQTEMREYVATGELSNLRKANYKFHLMIYEAANMPYSLKIIKTLWAQSPWDALYVLPGRAPKSLEEHERILTAIAEQDSKAAGQRVQEHIEYAASALAEYVDRPAQSIQLTAADSLS
jgi:DNA-binding GntR family transcriptional regulator